MVTNCNAHPWKSAASSKYFSTYVFTLQVFTKEAINKQIYRI